MGCLGSIAPRNHSDWASQRPGGKAGQGGHEKDDEGEARTDGAEHRPLILARLGPSPLPSPRDILGASILGTTSQPQSRAPVSQERRNGQRIAERILPTKSQSVTHSLLPYPSHTTLYPISYYYLIIPNSRPSHSNLPPSLSFSQPSPPSLSPPPHTSPTLHSLPTAAHPHG